MVLQAGKQLNIITFDDFSVENIKKVSSPVNNVISNSTLFTGISSSIFIHRKFVVWFRRNTEDQVSLM